MAVAFAVIVAAFDAPLPSKKIIIGASDEVYSTGNATAEEAQAHGKTGTSIAFVVPDGGWKEAETVAVLRTIAARTAPSEGGLPLKMQLLDSGMDKRSEALITQ